MPSSGFDGHTFVKTLPGSPGVYRMLDAEQQVLYVGKAKNLQRRVSSYFTRSLSAKTQLMISQVAAIEVTLTHTESEALLLENNLIKALKPKYNILLRDDKSYPYIYLSIGEAFPRIAFHRGARKLPGRYFGPYPNSSSVRETLHLLQKVFPIRQCEDSVFRNRSRPCLQYQIKRCSAPCVGFVNALAYHQDIEHVQLFLDGKDDQLTAGLVTRMQQAADHQDYEMAALVRDRIADLKRVQERQYISGEKGDLDILACVVSADRACIQQFFIRNGRNLGNRPYFPKLPQGASPQAVLNQFISQHYLGNWIPAEILVNARPSDKDLLEEALSVSAGKKVRISDRLRAERARWVELAVRNAQVALELALVRGAGQFQRVQALQEVLELDELPRRMVCFDISHTQGEGTVASCVAFNEQGPATQEYRRYNIRSATQGDDYAAMAEALQRYLTRVATGEWPKPDLLMIDGGVGQLRVAHEQLQQKNLPDIMLLGVSKGPGRQLGMELLHRIDHETPLMLPEDSPALAMIQQLRDEAHRFAITGHRQKRAAARKRSTLEDIPGIGAKRRQRLLSEFGGLQELSRAGVEDLARVKGISLELAKTIYDVFHG